MRIAVLGAGAWGTAIAGALCNRHEVRLWSRDPDAAQAMRATRRNERYLPSCELPPALEISGDLDGTLAHAREGLALLAVPTASLGSLAQALRERAFAADCAWLCKGLERSSQLLPHEIIAAQAPQLRAGPLSGPSFADEVARGLPTALVMAGDAPLCERVTRTLHGGNLRIYSTDDVVGVETGGAVKNVLAIATGISDALALGSNARAALVTRGLNEARRLGEALGGRAETFMGLAGVGDVLLTCTGDLSRNRQVGLALGRGEPLDQVLARLGHVAEGVWSAPAIAARAAALGVEVPIIRAVCAVIEGRSGPGEAVGQLLSRDPRPERA